MSVNLTVPLLPDRSALQPPVTVTPDGKFSVTARPHVPCLRPGRREIRACQNVSRSARLRIGTLTVAGSDSLAETASTWPDQQR